MLLIYENTRKKIPGIFYFIFLCYVNDYRQKLNIFSSLDEVVFVNDESNKGTEMVRSNIV